MTTWIQRVNGATHLARHSRRWRPEIGVVKARFSHPKIQPEREHCFCGWPSDEASLCNADFTIVTCDASLLLGMLACLYISQLLIVVNEEITAGSLTKLLMWRPTVRVEAGERASPRWLKLCQEFSAQAAAACLHHNVRIIGLVWRWRVFMLSCFYPKPFHLSGPSVVGPERRGLPQWEQQPHVYFILALWPAAWQIGSFLIATSG